MAVARRTCPGWLTTSSPATYRLAGDDLEEDLHHVEPAPAGLAGSARRTGRSSSSLVGVLATVLSPASIRRVLRPGSGGIRFAGALDSAIDRRSADGEQFG